MIFILMLMLLALTYIIPAQAMANKPDYEKKCAIIKAYFFNTFTIADESTQQISFQADEKQYHENLPTIKAIFHAALLNKNPLFSKKAQIEINNGGVNYKPRASYLEQYNVLCHYLQKQVINDYTKENKDQIMQNRISLKLAFNNENIDYIKAIQGFQGITPEQFEQSISNYLEEEFKKIPSLSNTIKTPTQKGWCAIV